MRPYEDADLEPIIALIRAHLGDYVTRHIGPWARSEAMLRADIPDARDHISVVVQRDQVIGFVWIELEEERLILEEIHVRTSSRGQGLGRQLMTFVERQARLHERRVVRLTAFRESPAVQFYERLGYTVVGENTARAQVDLEKTLTVGPQN